MKFAVLVAFTMSLVPSPAFGYVLYGTSWRSLPVRFHLSNTFQNSGFAMSNLETIATTAIGHWGEPACSGATSEYAGRTSSSAFALDDGKNVFSWVSRNWFLDAAVLGVTSRQLDNEGYIRDADIALNGVDWAWSNGSSLGVDFESIVTHETGHLWGLDHSRDREATMYFAYDGGTAQRSLEADDIEGICFMYPRPYPLGEACALDAECEAGLFCFDDGTYQYCSGLCAADEECPAEFYCLPGADRFCVYGPRTAEGDGGAVTDDGGGSGGCF